MAIALMVLKIKVITEECGSSAHREVNVPSNKTQKK
jgi:hypothetical protein